MPRLFVSVQLAAPIAQQFPTVVHPGGTELPPHITVLYIEAVAPELVPKALAAVRGVAERGVGFDLEVDGLGYFEHPAERRRVAWAGVKAGDVELRALRRDILAALCAAGVAAPQKYNFTPHATVAFIGEGEEWSGAVPTGSMRVEQLRLTVDTTPADLALGAPADGEATARAWREPGGGPVSADRDFVGATVGTVFTRYGQLYGEITPESMAEMVRVFEARRDLDPVPLDWAHGSGDEGPPEETGALGRITAMWVEGDKLWMRPRWNARGRKVLKDHEAVDAAGVPTGESDAWPSPEFVVDPAGLTCRRSGEVYGWAQVLAVAVTPRPAQVAAAITPLRLSERRRALAERERSVMDPKKLMQLLRGKGVSEEEIQDALGDDYVAPGAAEKPAAPMAEELAAEKPEDAPEKKPEVSAMSERLAAAEKRATAAEKRAAVADKRTADLEKQVNTMWEERQREDANALERHIEAEHGRAVAEGRCPLGEEHRFAFFASERRAEGARRLARKGNAAVTADELAKLPEVREHHAHYGEARPDLADLATVHGHSQRGAPGQQGSRDALSAKIKAVAKERGVTYREADNIFHRESPGEYRRLFQGA